MGLTIHYSLSTKLTNPSQVEETVRKMRQLALDLPFEQVGEVQHLSGKECDVETRRAELQGKDEESESLFWILIQATKSVKCPWNKRINRRVNPTRIIAFDTWPGPGSEAANIGLCLYPTEVEWEYDPEDDQKFQKLFKGDYRHRFCWDKWYRHLQRNPGMKRWPSEHKGIRMVPTNLPGWSWGSFCKTQYASDPDCGGLPNFLRCHISVITLLDRIAKLSGVKVGIEDEGKYGPSTYSDDWQEARQEGRKPTYRRHKGRYNPAELAREVGDWNQMVAAFAGALGDALSRKGLTLEAPIKDFSDFERLEFKGRQAKNLDPFLKAMDSLVKAGQP